MANNLPPELTEALLAARAPSPTARATPLRTSVTAPSPDTAYKDQPTERAPSYEVVTRPARRRRLLDEDGPLSRLENPLTWVLLFVLGTATQLLRASSLGLWRTLWAEDGQIFVTQQLQTGFGRALFTSYNGYGHLAPRLLAALAAQFSIYQTATLVCVESAVLAALCATLIARASRRLIPSFGLRIVLYLVVLLLPAARVESLVNLANLQWYLIPTAMWIALWRPQRLYTQALALLVVLLAVGSSPLALVILPIVIWRLWIYRDRYEVTLLLATVLASTYQAFLVATVAVAHYPGTVSATLPRVLDLFGLRVAAGSLGGWNLTLWSYAKYHYLPGLIVLGLVTVATLVSLALYRNLRTLVALGMLASSAGLFCSNLYLRGLPTGLSGSLMLLVSARYSLAPLVLFFSALALLLQPLVARPTWSRYLLFALCAAMFLSWLPSEEALALRTPATDWVVAVNAARQSCTSPTTTAPTNSPTTTTSLPTASIATTPAGWSVGVPCGVLLRATPPPPPA